MVEALKKVNFSLNMGDSVWFDSTGRAVAQYEVVNWQQDSDGSIEFKSVGYYDASLPPNQRFLLNTENIIWAGGQVQVTGSNLFFLRGLIRLRELRASFSKTAHMGVEISASDLLKMRKLKNPDTTSHLQIDQCNIPSAAQISVVANKE